MSRRLRAACAAAIIAVGLTIAGCAADGSTLDAETSQQWQERVVAIAESAGAGDPATGLTELAALEAETVQARQDGEISAERAAIIQQSIDVVRADLEAAAAVPETPAPEETVVSDPVAPVDDDSPTDDDKADDSGKGDKKDDEKPDKGKKDKDD